MNLAEISKLRQDMVVAKLIYDPSYRAEVTTFLQTRDFPDTNYRKLYAHLLTLNASGEAVDALKLNEVVPDIELPTQDLSKQNLDYFDLAKILHQSGNKFRVQSALSDFLDKSDTKDFDFDKELSDLQRKLSEPMQVDFGMMVGEGAVVELTEGWEREYKTFGLCGIRKIDELIGGFEPEHIYSVVAASGVGKSMFGIQIFHESVKQGNTCLYLSNEMPRTEIVARMVARDMGIAISSLRIRKKQFDGYEGQVGEAVGRLAEAMSSTKSVISEGAQKFEKAVNVIRLSVARHGVKLVVIDHLNNFYGANKYEEMSMMAHKIQGLAQELGIAVVMLSQVSLATKRSEDSENVTAKGAGDIEEVSNVLVSLKRKRVDNGGSVDKDESSNYMRITVHKNRDGATGYTYARVEFPNMILVQDE